MRKYVGEGRKIPGVPAADLTEEEWAEHVAAGRIIETCEITGDDGTVSRVPSSGAALWEKMPEGRARPAPSADEGGHE
jgi:hypothetical protein